MTPRTEPAQPVTDQVAIHAIEPGAECWCGHPAAPPSEWKLAPEQEAAALSPEAFEGYIDEFGDERQHPDPTSLDVERLAGRLFGLYGDYVPDPIRHDWEADARRLTATPEPSK